MPNTRGSPPKKGEIAEGVWNKNSVRYYKSMHPSSRSLVIIAALFAVLAIPLFMFMASRANGTQAPSLVITAAHAEYACGPDDPFCLKKAATGGGLTPGGDAPSIPAAVGKILSSLLALLGVLFFALTVWAGFKWMTAQGNQETATSAKTTLENAVIGLVLVVVAYALTTYVVNALFWSSPDLGPGGVIQPGIPPNIRGECELIYNGRCTYDSQCHQTETQMSVNCTESGQICCVPLQNSECERIGYSCYASACPTGHNPRSFSCNDAALFCCD